MLSYFIFFILIFSILEWFIIIKVSAFIGAWNAFLLILCTGLLGLYLVQLQGYLIIQKIRDNMDRGVMPSKELWESAFILAGGVLFLIPGFLTDGLGFLLFFPSTRHLILFAFNKLIDRYMAEHGDQNSSYTRRRSGSYDDIDLN